MSDLSDYLLSWCYKVFCTTDTNCWKTHFWQMRQNLLEVDTACSVHASTKQVSKIRRVFAGMRLPKDLKSVMPSNSTCDMHQTIIHKSSWQSLLGIGQASQTVVRLVLASPWKKQKEFLHEKFFFMKNSLANLHGRLFTILPGFSGTKAQYHKPKQHSTQVPILMLVI